ncbi:hypothetical protein [Cupriavidus necator]|uniref:hypothetical protein n=1 Tax=Cupriavidus necator TaxID=106590 RepID=UPI00339D9B76
MAQLPRNEAEPLIALRKFVGSDLHLQPRKNHAGYVSGAARPEDEFGATLPGLTVELELKAPLLVDACKHIVTLFLLKNGVKYRVYQFEVQPPSKRSHNEPGNAIFGPHEHRGDEVIAYDRAEVHCGTPVETLFELFCSEANISFTGKIILP